MDKGFDLFAAADEGELSIVFLDTETTGSDPEKDYICELAMVRTSYSGLSRVSEPDRLSTLVRPPQPIPPEASAVHHITNAMVEDAPSAPEISERVAGIAGEADLICAHNLPFDLTLLRRAYPEVFDAFREPTWLDSLRLSRHVWPTLPSHALQALRYRFDLDANLSGDAHRACFDTELTRALVERIAASELAGMATWREVAELARSPLEVQVFYFGKYRGNLVEDIVVRDADYVRWLLSQDWLPREYPDLYHTLLRKSGAGNGGR
jgi:exodeoxyribonuclease X